jgi:DNA-binding GntR family transcriptional regulator
MHSDSSETQRQENRSTAAMTGGSSPVRQGGRLSPPPEGVLPSRLSYPESPVNAGPLKKAALYRLSITSFPRQKPDFDLPGASKDNLIAAWLKDWMDHGFEQGVLNATQILPTKADLAAYLGVSIGTVQNAIRFIEDEGYVESKQRIGTILRSPQERHVSRLRKQVSKREHAAKAICQRIVELSIQPGEALPSARILAKTIGSAPNTTRLALDYLCSEGLVTSHGVRGNRANWFLKALPAAAQCSGESTANGPVTIETETLIDQLEGDLKALILERFEVGVKLPSHLDLAEQFKVSIKTVHDALRRLNQQGIVLSRRGRYGTSVLRLPSVNTAEASAAMETLFVPVQEQEATLYHYERAESELRHYISHSYRPQDKLPPMAELAKQFDVSSNTVRRALQKLAQDGMITLSRGRHGGTFVN